MSTSIQPVTSLTSSLDAVDVQLTGAPPVSYTRPKVPTLPQSSVSGEQSIVALSAQVLAELIDISDACDKLSAMLIGEGAKVASPETGGTSPTSIIGGTKHSLYAMLNKCGQLRQTLGEISKGVSS